MEQGAVIKEGAGAASPAILAVNNIEVIYDHVILVLKGVSLSVPRGGITALLGANVVAARQWCAVGGAPLAAGLSAAYWTAMGVSHPLAKKVGTWPSVLGVTAASAGAAWLLADRRTR